MAYESPRSQLGIWPQRMHFEGQSFEFVTRQRGDKSAVYKSENAYLRIGDPERILPDLALHKKMEAAGFPVAGILGEGELDGQAYVIESSLGETHLGNAFAEDVERDGGISEKRFEELLSVAERFARAQLTTRSQDRNYQEFSRGILFERVCEEFPDDAERLRARFEKVKQRTDDLPFVITHGDFNPNNLYPLGVIDLEDSFHGPYGYDLISAIDHINHFPDSKEYEYVAGYRFTSEQRRIYFERLDIISVEAGLAPLSEFEEDLEFCRAVWLLADIPHTPKLQKFRYELLVERFLA